MPRPTRPTDKLWRGVNSRFLLLFVFFALCACLHFKRKPTPYALKNTGRETKISVLTFNILAKVDLKARTAGYPPWHQRREAIFSYVGRIQPSLAALQECTDGQREEITLKFKKTHSVISFPAATSDVILLVSHSQFSIREAGYWNLDKSFKGIVRIAVWSKLKDKQTGRELVFIGTHLDASARQQQQIHFLTKQIAKLVPNNVPVFVAGDFNFNEKDASFAKFVAGGWTDSFNSKTLSGGLFTYPYKEPNTRIDHIFYQGAAIEPLHWEAGYQLNLKKEVLSDHVPVYAEFTLAEAP